MAEPVISSYEQMVKSKSCKICVFGTDDIVLMEQFMEVLRYKRCIRRQDQWRPQIKDIKDAITFYKSAPMRFRIWGMEREDISWIQSQIINSFLTEQAYNHKSIKYSNIIKNYQYSTFQDFRRYGRYGYLAGAINNNINIDNQSDNDDDDEKEEKYLNTNDDDNDDRIPLKIKHILEADGFMILYDVRYQNGLDKIRNCLDEIFELKGYNKLIDKVRSDQMCLFPISLIGVNGDIITDDKQKICKTQINNVAMKYCVDNEQMLLFHHDYGIGDLQKRGEIRGFVQMIVDYHYYTSLSNDQIEKLKIYSKSQCSIL